MQFGRAACRGSARQLSWELVNGFWSLFLAFGLTLTALLTRTAHSWRFGNTLTRQLITDYGAPLMVRCHLQDRGRLYRSVATFSGAQCCLLLE